MSTPITFIITPEQEAVLREKHQKECPDIPFDEFFNSAMQKAIEKIARDRHKADQST